MGATRGPDDGAEHGARLPANRRLLVEGTLDRVALVARADFFFRRSTRREVEETVQRALAEGRPLVDGVEDGAIGTRLVGPNSEMGERAAADAASGCTISEPRDGGALRAGFANDRGLIGFSDGASS